MDLQEASRNFTEASKIAKDIWWSYDFSNGIATKLFEMVGSKMEYANQFQKGKLLYVNNGVLYLFAFPDTNPVTIDTDGAYGGDQLALSPNGQDVFYIKHRSSASEKDGLYKYSLATRARTLTSADVQGCEVILGSNQAEDQIFIGDAGQLRVLRNGQSEVVKTISAAHYQVSPDGSKVLVIKIGRQGFVDEVGIYDVRQGTYRVITPQLAGLTKGFLDSNISGFTDNSLGIEGFLNEGVRRSTYWILDLASAKWTKVFTTDKGLLTSKYPGELSFLTRTMMAYQGNQLKLRYFLEPELASENVFATDEEKADGTWPSVYFAGWIPN
jgi:hypothetical protein